MATAIRELTPLQRRFTTSAFYGGNALRGKVLDNFRVVDGVLEGLVIFPNRLGIWKESVPASDLEKDIPNLSPDEMKRLILAINVSLASDINGSTPDQAFFYFGFTLGERLESGLYAVTKFDASHNGYRVVEQRRIDSLRRS